MLAGGGGAKPALVDPLDELVRGQQAQRFAHRRRAGSSRAFNTSIFSFSPGRRSPTRIMRRMAL